MKTKFVYALVSNDNDIYAETAWVSMWSLKNHNPKAHIALVMDKDTARSIETGSRKPMFDLVDEKLVIDVPMPTPFERNRWMKTSLRNHVVGDYLYIDNDTVIVGDLSGIDHVEGDIAMVRDMHIPFDQHPSFELLRNNLRRVFGLRIKDNEYFNGGMLYCKDSDYAHSFYNTWHKNWLLSNERGWKYDQLALYATTSKYHVSHLPDVYNCMISASLKYLYDAKIIHFFADTKTPFTPFKDASTYQEVKKCGCIPEHIQEMIINCKREFHSPTKVLDWNEATPPALPEVYKICLALPVGSFRRNVIEILMKVAYTCLDPKILLSKFGLKK